MPGKSLKKGDVAERKFNILHLEKKKPPFTFRRPFYFLYKRVGEFWPFSCTDSDRTFYQTNTKQRIDEQNLF